MKLFKFKPTRDSHDKDVEVVADLDALISESVAFRFQGKTFEIRPLSAGEAFVAWQNLIKLDELKKKETVSFEEIIRFYTDLFGSVCPEIKEKHIREMTQTQCTALLTLILDTVTGKAFSDSKKKLMEAKNQLAP